MHGEFQVRGYDLETLLGASSSGEMWLARVQGSGDQVALKRLRLRDAAAREGLGQIVSLLGLLDHPHVVRIREVLPDGDEAVLVLDHADGGSLDHLLSGRGGIDPGEVVTTVGPIAEALAAAHQHGLVHGDVTPEAILFTADGRPLLADLGVLTLVEGAEALGTHGYADPTGTGDSGPTPAGDVFGLAAVCYTALTGVAPRPGQARPELSEAVPGLPSELVHAVSAGLQSLPARRPDAAQFADLVFAACPPAPVRFPIGLVLSDADIAAALGDSAPDPGSGRPAGQRSEQPSVRGSAAPVAGSAPPVGPSSAVGTPADGPSVRDPFAAAGFPIPGSEAPPGGDPADDEKDGPRLGLIIASVLSFVLLAGAVVGGIAWAQRARPADPAAAGETDAQRRDARAAASVPGPAKDSPEGATGRRGSDEVSTPRHEKSPPPANASNAPVTPEDRAARTEATWQEVLIDLDRKRAKAYAESDPGLLSGVYVADSELLAQDRDEIGKCVRAGCHVEGLRFDVKSLRVVSSGDGEVVLEVIDQLQAYTVVTDSGERTDRPAGEVTTRRITLVRSSGNWRIVRIVGA
ncbi:MAG: protein kinase domain-containing protein [Actinopolymorphaceae bacterium]